MIAFLKRLFGKKTDALTETRTDRPKAAPSAFGHVSTCNQPMKLRVMGTGSEVNYQPGGLYSSACLWWVSEETDADGQPVFIRESEEHMTKVPAALPFTAAGKVYKNLTELSPQDVIDGMDTDVHGRQVLCYRERFPCFDSYDYLHEHRYYRWFFLKENGKLTRIYTADESGWIFVTEDAENIENKCTELLKQCGWVE